MTAAAPDETPRSGLVPKIKKHPPAVPRRGPEAGIYHRDDDFYNGSDLNRFMPN